MLSSNFAEFRQVRAVRGSRGSMVKRFGLVTFVALWALAAAPFAAPALDAQAPTTQAPAGQQPGEPAPADGQPPADQDGEAPGQPIFRAGINFVRVDVIVTDRQGNPVLDLKPTDFTVTESGKPQDVESFKLVRVDEVQHTTPPREIRSLFDEESEAQRDDVRLFAIFLDDYHVRRGSSMFAREPLIRFIRTQLRPSDMVGIMYPLTPLGDVRMTRNHEAIARAIEQFDGRKYDYTPRNQFEEQYANYPATVVERVRNEVSMSALRALVTRMGSLREGRKAIILVSEGYTNYLPPQLRDPVASMPGYGNPARRMPGAEAAGNLGEDRAAFFSQAEMLGELRRVYDAANRNNTAIYALDPRGLAPFEHDINEGVGLRTDAAMLRSTQDSLRILADETDGRAIINQNDLERGLRQIVRDTSVYYLLGYNSSEAPQDGKFHEIRVRVNRPGVQVRHRKGYWALTVEETARALEPPKPAMPREFDAALASITGGRSPSQPHYVRTWFGTARGEDGKTRVTFVWEPVPRQPGVRSEEAARVNLTALAPDGSAYFRGRVPDARFASAAEPTSGATGAAPPRSPSQIVFDANPGRIQLRYQVEDASSGVLDTDVREFTVPDLTAPQVQLSSPHVLRARSVREFREMNTDPAAAPTASREFRRTDRLIIRFDAYGPGTEQPAVTARLLNRTGQPILDIPVAPASAGFTHQMDVPLAGIAAAEYVIEILAKGDSGEAKELVGFRVVG
jgi:VWFA-related protein